MAKPTKRQQGEQQHAEGAHGARTTDAIRAQMNSGPRRDDEPESGSGTPREGGHRIYEDRQQHDEADKNSEKNRLAKDIDAGRADATDAPRGEPGRSSS